MNRLGRTLLILFVALTVGFVALIRFGPGTAPEVPATAPPAAPAAGALTMPVAGVRADQLADTFGDARGGGTRRHGALDIMAPRGTPVLAAAPGTVEKIFESDLGGHTVYVRSSDGARVYYYAHLDSYAPGLAEGRAVTAGMPLGTVGSTGDASADAPHLHFEVKLMGPGEGWWQGTALNPYPLLTGS